MRSLAILCAVFGYACGEANEDIPDFVSDMGIQVFDSSGRITVQDVDFVAAHVQAYATELDGAYAHASFTGVRLYTLTHPPEGCGSKTGCTSGKTIEVHWQLSCWRYHTLGHEMIHFMRNQVFDNSDIAHTDVGLFGENGVDDKAYRATTALCQ